MGNYLAYTSEGIKVSNNKQFCEISLYKRQLASGRVSNQQFFVILLYKKYSASGQVNNYCLNAILCNKRHLA